MAKYFYLFIALFLLSCSEEHPMTEVQFGSDATLDIITWNIENFPKESITLEYVQDLILSLDPDIVALQEISSLTSFNLLADNLGDDWVGYRYSDSNWGELAYLVNLSHINIITEPYAILNTYEHYFAGRPPYFLEIEFLNEDGIPISDEDGNPKRFEIINVHFKCCGDGNLEEDYWDEEYRRKQASYYLKEYIDNYYFDYIS